MLKYFFSASLEVSGIHLADIECSANISVAEDDPSDWHIESWSVHGLKADQWSAAAGWKRVEGEVEINRHAFESDRTKEILRTAILNAWHRDRLAHESSVADLVNADVGTEPGVVPQIAHDRAIHHQSVL